MLLTHEKVNIQCSFGLQHLTTFQMESTENNHATAIFSGIIFDDIGFAELEKNIIGENIKFVETKSGSAIFCGIVTDISIENENGYYTINCCAKSGTFLLDQQKKSRSFQDINMTYGEVVNTVLEDTEKSSCIFTIGEDKPIGYPIIQYLETDWEFIKRLASHFGAPLFPELTRGEPKFWFGLKKSSQDVEFKDFDYSIKIDEKYYSMWGENLNYQKSDFLHYIVKSSENYTIGDKTTFKQKNLYVCRKSCVFEKDILEYTYHIGQHRLVSQLKQFNDLISGMSILGTVLETDKETLKIHLDIDENQEVETAYPYKWVPTTGNLMYLMPKVGTRVSLYFQNADEMYARANNCVRTNGGDQCFQMSDFEKRRLQTEHEKFMLLFPEQTGFIGTSKTETPLSILMDDNEGISVISSGIVCLLALEKITLNAPIIQFGAERLERALRIARVSESKNLDIDGVTGSGTESSTIPDSLIAIESMKSYVGSDNGNAYYAGWVFTKYSAYDDAPKEGEFNGWELFGKVIAGVAVVAAVAIIGTTIAVATGGLAVAAAPTVMAIAGVSGTFAVGGLALHDVIRGNVSGLDRYIKTAFASTLSSVICGCIGAGMNAALDGVTSAFRQFMIKAGYRFVMGSTSSLIRQSIFSIGDPNYKIDFMQIAIDGTGFILTGAIADGIIGIGKPSANTRMPGLIQNQTVSPLQNAAADFASDVVGSVYHSLANNARNLYEATQKYGELTSEQKLDIMTQGITLGGLFEDGLVGAMQGAMTDRFADVVNDRYGKQIMDFVEDPTKRLRDFAEDSSKKMTDFANDAADVMKFAGKVFKKALLGSLAMSGSIGVSGGGSEHSGGNNSDDNYLGGKNTNKVLGNPEYKSKTIDDKASGLKFGDVEKLEGHFSKHGGEFGKAFSSADEYLAGANDVIKNGTKVQYSYNGEIRTGYVKFMKNSSLTNANGVPIKSYAKFEFVGTNNLGEITTYHVESGKTFWKMMNNGTNIPVINPIE